MHTRRRLVVQSLGASALLANAGSRAFAQTGGPLPLVKVVTGFPPSGTSDTICRRLAPKLQPGYGKSVVVENRAGAGGQIAVQSMKGAPADGSVILQTPMSMLGIYPLTYQKLSYDPIADLTPISLGAVFDFGFAVGPAVPVGIKTMPEFLAWCKANPGLANFGSPGAGSVPHFYPLLAGRSVGVELKHIPYRGTQPAILDLIGGQVQAVSGPVGEFTQHVTAGKIRLLATSGVKRSKFAPSTPTLLEQNFKEMAFSEWFGFYMPSGGSSEALQTANAAIRTALANQEVIEGLEVMGLEAKSSTSSELAALLKSDSERWAPIIKSIGFSADS